MTSPSLRRLDDRLLGSALLRGRSPAAGARGVWSVAVRVTQLVLLALAAVLVLAVVFVVAPVNEGNAVVSAVLAGADRVAGPGRDVFAFDARPVRALTNYGLVAVVYAVAARLVGRLHRA